MQSISEWGAATLATTDIKGFGAYMKTGAAVPVKVIAGEVKMRTSPVLMP
jgi:hypothetical protein